MYWLTAHRLLWPSAVVANGSKTFQRHVLAKAAWHATFLTCGQLGISSSVIVLLEIPFAVDIYLLEKPHNQTDETVAPLSEGFFLWFTIFLLC